MDWDSPFAAVLVMVGCVAAIVIFYAIHGVVSCGDVEKQASVPTKWSFWSGCYVQLDGKWVPEARWRTLSDGK